MISAKVIADSESAFGDRVTTMIVTMPRFILAEFNTHRMFSRNSASSRAIPFEKMVKSVEENPFIPIAWQKDHSGMQGTEYMTNQDDIDYSVEMWLAARDEAVHFAKYLSSNGTTKQLCNRLLEPFMYHTVIVTSSEWENFFALRCPKYRFIGSLYRSKKDVLLNYPDDKVECLELLDWLHLNEGQAEIHMMALAEAMYDALQEGTPKNLADGEWHIPFSDNIDHDTLVNFIANEMNGEKTEYEYILNRMPQYLIKISTARCARVSYTVVGEEGKPVDFKKDIELHDRLAASGHWSPFEHICRPLHFKDKKHLQGNLKGFVQYRKTFLNENITK